MLFAKRLGYKPISLFTNSLLLPEREEVLDHVDYLQVSLDTLNENQQDRMAGQENVGRRVKANIQRYAALQGEKKFRMDINCVVSRENMDEIPALLRFARQNNVRFSLCPELDERHMPREELTTGQYAAKYRRTIGHVLKYNRSSNVAVDIKPVLEHMKTFEGYTCYPSLTPRVYPDGSFIFPCPTLCKRGVNVLAAGSWPRLMEAAGNDEWACDAPCFLPCYLETSLLVRHPLSILKELGGHHG